MSTQVNATLAPNNVGTSLQTLLMCDEIVPGASPSYEICKIIYTYHPLGRKMVEGPIQVAQSLEREMSVPVGPEKTLRERYMEEWRKCKADEVIKQFGSVARTYGAGSVVVVIDDVKSDEPLDLEKIYKQRISFNIMDPLNTAGSLVLNQDPNALDFQKHTGVSVNGKPYHRSRCVTLFNEDPIYIEYTTSAYGFVGRSVYQRALYPLKSFIETMVTDDMVAKKAGVIVAMLKAPGAIIDYAMQVMAGVKRSILKEARTDNVITIGPDDKVESLNLQNVDGAMSASRKNILENIASAADMPAKMLSAETLAVAFAEGEEDAKMIVRYVEGIRRWLEPAYEFMDEIVMRRAWNPDFYKTVQEEFKAEYGKMEYNAAFYQWRNSVKFKWPSLLIEAESEKATTEDIKQKAMVALLETLLPSLDPSNQAKLIECAVDNIFANKTLFPHPLMLDFAALEEHLEEQAEQQKQQAQMGAEQGEPGAEPKTPQAPKPFAAAA